MSLRVDMHTHGRARFAFTAETDSRGTILRVQHDEQHAPVLTLWFHGEDELAELRDTISAYLEERGYQEPARAV